MERNLSQPELAAVLIGILTLMWAGIWLFCRWVINAPAAPDPWGEEVAAEVAGDDCPQICHRCLTQHDSSAHFCPRCGAMVGMYTCLIPPLYLYSIGDVFRAGVDGGYRRSSLLTAGYFFIAFSCVYWVPFPIGLFLLFFYWDKLLKNIPKPVEHPNEGS